MNRLAGWWGNKEENRFLMNRDFDPASDATGWQLSTPSILLFACLKASLSIFEHAGWNNILAKQDLMKRWLKFLLDDLIDADTSGAIKCLTPTSRGCQVSLFFKKDGKKVFDQLTQKGFMLDWREPGVVRFAPVPLYNTFTEICNLYEALKSSIDDIFSDQQHYKNISQ